MGNNNILTFFNSSIVYKVQEITERIKKSKEYSHEYFMYKSNSLISKSKSEDDWNFCILVLKFINKSSDFEDIDELIEVLKYFLYRDRYRDKLVQHNTYLIKTLKKVIWHVLKLNLLGSCLILQENNINDITNININSSSRESYKSILKSDIVKVCNIFNFFYLNSKNPFSKELVVDCSKSDDNQLKVHMQGGLLNDFDLIVLICILRQYNNPFDVFKLDVSSILDLVGYDTGYSRRKLFSSLKKLSMTTVDCRKQYLRFKSDSMQHSEDHFYSFCGNLLSFENLSTTKLTALNIKLSLLNNKYNTMYNYAK
nr:hypothetical protein [Gracilaria tikvahiae]